MSSLAFDKQGKPFAFQRRTRKLLVRLFRNPSARGTCCQVLGADGSALYIDPETDYVEFRRAVGQVPGLYRLDQCDEDGNELEDAQPAYVSIDVVRNAQTGDAATGDVNPLVIIQQMAAIQADVMKTMAQQQAALIAATAEILRAPYRPAPIAVAAPELRNAVDSSDDDEDRDDEIDEEPEPESTLVSVARMVDSTMPNVAANLGEFLYEKIFEFLHKKKNATAIATPAPVAAAPTVAGTASYAPPPSPAAPATTSHSPSPAPEAVAHAAASTPSTITGNAALEAATLDDAAADETAPLTPTPAQMAHVLAVAQQLDAKERAIAEAAMNRMTLAQKAHWLAELSQQSVQDAAATIRELIAQIRPAAPRSPQS